MNSSSGFQGAIGGKVKSKIKKMPMKKPGMSVGKSQPLPGFMKKKPSKTR